MVTLKYIGTHQPQGMLIEAKEEDVKRLLNSGEYVYLSEPIKAASTVIVEKEASNDDSKRLKSKI